MSGHPHSVIVYPVHLSSVDGHKGQHPNDRHFVNVWNCGTSEFLESRLNDFMEMIPWDDLVEREPCDPDQKRGNYQTNFGFSSGQCQENKTDDLILENFGHSKPALRSGTKEDPVIMKTMSVVSQILECVAGVVWTDHDYLANNPGVSARLKLYSNSIPGEEGTKIVLELLSVCHMLFVVGAKVERHTDDQNCKDLTQAVVLQRCRWSEKNQW
jgi:hypothetical protein